MNTVTVRNITFGTGTPLICVPLMGKTREEIVVNAHELLLQKADLVEWRVDHFSQVSDQAAVKSVLSALRDIMPATPLLFTFRSKKEGGECQLSDDDYFALNAMAAGSGLVDLIDVELFNDEKRIAQLVGIAHECNVRVIMSNHDFHKTPPKEEIIWRLRRMQELGADLPKIAVMPQTRQDVLVLLDATTTMAELYATQPLITMSMGKLGVISRLCGEVFHSSMTFGAVGQASAPGQISVSAMRAVLPLLSA
ncbi:3-dehydroquinate dehydratase [Mangrovibacter plantisponsor]|uniref:3-dehydroquinate dehydratase n=2 Tax=Enterobacteriaceae TaxID=543 RepID=A0A317Q201_9ENTR|nr:3-dehydroquinate dehydratase [Mangrovibacter plantisponsor]